MSRIFVGVLCGVSAQNVNYATRHGLYCYNTAIMSLPGKHRNVRLLYVLNLIAGIAFWYPIEKLFLQELGASALGVSVNAMVFLLTMIIFDVPSGVLADKWKRHYVLAMGLLLMGAACIVGGMSDSLLQYLPMNILFGGFVVLTSGTFQAMMYDSLKDSGHQKEYDKLQGRSYALFLAGIGFSSIGGGYLADWFGMPAAYFITAAVAVVGAGICLLLKEPTAHKNIVDRKLGEHIRFSVRKIAVSPLLMQLALLCTAAGIVRGAQNEYSGLLFIALGMSVIPMGYANAGKWITSAFGQLVAPRIGRRALRLVPVFFFAALGFSLIHSAWTLVLFYFASFLYSVIANQAEAAVQDVTPSEIRATTLSLLSFATNVLLVPIGLLFGWMATQTDVFDAYFFLGMIGMLYLASWLIVGRRTIAGLWKNSSTPQ